MIIQTFNPLYNFITCIPNFTDEATKCLVCFRRDGRILEILVKIFSHLRPRFFSGGFWLFTCNIFCRRWFIVVQNLQKVVYDIVISGCKLKSTFVRSTNKYYHWTFWQNIRKKFKKWTYTALFKMWAHGYNSENEWKLHFSYHKLNMRNLW